MFNEYSLNTYYVPTSDPGSKVISKSMKDGTATQLYFKSNWLDMFHDPLTRYTGPANHSEDGKNMLTDGLGCVLQLQCFWNQFNCYLCKRLRGTIEKHIACQPLTLAEHVWGLEHVGWEPTGETGGRNIPVWILDAAPYNFSSVVPLRYYIQVCLV